MKHMLAVLGLFLAVGCDSVEVPEKVAVAQAATHPTLAATGESLFGANCSRCHAFQGNAAPDLVGAGARLSAEQFQTVVTEGRAGMPAHPNLTAAQKDALWAFISTATKESPAIAKTREGQGCSCGGACGGAGMGAGAGHKHGAKAGAGEGCGGACGGGGGQAAGCGGACGGGGQVAGAAEGQAGGGGGCGCGRHGG